MRTITPPTTLNSSPDPDAGYQAILDQVVAAADRIRQRAATARHAAPGRRVTVLTELAVSLRAAGEQLGEQLPYDADGGWPPLPPVDEAP